MYYKFRYKIDMVKGKEKEDLFMFYIDVCFGIDIWYFSLIKLIRDYCKSGFLLMFENYWVKGMDKFKYLKRYL